MKSLLLCSLSITITNNGKFYLSDKIYNCLHKMGTLFGYPCCCCCCLSGRGCSMMLSYIPGPQWREHYAFTPTHIICSTSPPGPAEPIFASRRKLATFLVDQTRGELWDGVPKTFSRPTDSWAFSN